MIRHYLELVRFSHTIFVLPFAALAAVWAAMQPLPGGGRPSIGVPQVAGLLICMVAARTAAMAFNRLVDHRIDAANPRTAARHLPAGTLSRTAVAALTIASGLAFIGGCGLFWPNPWPLLAAGPVLLWLLGYSLAKRFTAAAHLWLGTALALSPLCVWLAIRGSAALGELSDWTRPAGLAAMIVFWVAGFDVIYACQDAAFDRGAGLHSLPSRFGVAGALRIAAGLHAICAVVLISLLPAGGWVWAAAVSCSVALILIQHGLVRPGDLSRVGVAFFQTNAIISTLLMIGGVIDTIL